MKFLATVVSASLAIGSTLIPAMAIASTPELPAAPIFNQVQMKVLVDNDFAVFMGNDQQATSQDCEPDHSVLIKQQSV
jgi:hypothetical protein